MRVPICPANETLRSDGSAWVCKPYADCTTGPVGTVCPDGAIYAGSLNDTRLYAAPNDEIELKLWSNVYVNTGATSTIDGLANTNTLVSLSDPYPAAEACRVKGSAWYFPSKDELNVMYTNRAAIGGFNTTGTGTSTWYWSSSEIVYSLPFIQRFSDGEQGTFGGKGKNGKLSVRCMRRDVPPQTNCTAPWGGVVNHGSSITAYASATVPYGSTCSSQNRNCTNGTLSGSYTHQNCTMSAPANCMLDGVTVTHGSVQVFYNAHTHASCSANSQSRTCSNGILSGGTTYQYANCSASQVEPPNCTIGPVGTICPDGAIYAGHLNGTRFYAAPQDEGSFLWSDHIYANTGATSTTDGLYNTNILVGLGVGYNAATACRAKGSAWYSPSKDELNVMYANRAAIGGFNLTGQFPNGYYWSSSENDNSNAFIQQFSDGAHINRNAKSSALSVRCVRR